MKTEVFLTKIQQINDKIKKLDKKTNDLQNEVSGLAQDYQIFSKEINEDFLNQKKKIKAPKTES